MALSLYGMCIRPPKKLLILFLLLCAASGLFAIDDIFAGLGLEINGHSRKNIAGGLGLAAGVDLNSRFALGLKFLASHNFDTVGALEPLGFFRYYLPLGGLFVQAEAGAVVYFEYGKTYPAFSGGLAAGWRFNLPKNWYLEPAIRGGYPFAFGLGITAGYKFNIPSRKTGKTAPDSAVPPAAPDNIAYSSDPGNTVIEEPGPGGIESDDAVVDDAVSDETIPDDIASDDIVFSSVPENIVVEETGGVKTVRLLNAVYFQADTSVLIEEYRPILDRAGERLLANPEESITLRGYTAPFGTPEGRAEISAARARFCADYLAEKYGIPESRMEVEYYGAERSPEFVNAGWESYRCVELIIQAAGGTLPPEGEGNEY